MFKKTKFKKKIKMKAGDTDKTVSFRGPELLSLFKWFINETGYRNQIGIYIFDINGRYYISEVNPHFDDGYP